MQEMDRIFDPDLVDDEPVGADLPPIRSLSIPFSVTPVLPADDPKPPGFVKDGRGLVPKSADFDPMFVKFVEDLASTPDLKAALAHVGSDKAMRFLAEICGMERKHGAGSKTIVKAAKKCGIGMDTLAEIWRSHSASLAMMKLVSATPKLADDLLEAARNTTVVCPACQGNGIIETPLRVEGARECPQCDGSGSVRRAGDKDARTHALEWAGVVNQPNRSGSAGGPSSVYLNLVLPRRESKPVPLPEPL